MDNLIQDLQLKLSQPLPGRSAQEQMTPEEISDERFDESRLINAKLSSVLVLFYKKNSEWHLPLTQRHEYPGAHSGQVSFPGGKWEETDPDLVFTAKREAHEEIGVRPDKVDVIGQLTHLYIPPSNFKVLPIVGYSEDPPEFIIEEREVKELIEVPLLHFMNPETRKQKKIKVSGGFRLNAPYFDVGGKVVWGATAMMLSELVSVVKSI
ncbi:MAG: CoA pyrophosphatase [Bacteroidota bacterium]